MAILSKACKPDNFELLSFMNIRGLRSNFVDCESFFESNSPDILVTSKMVKKVIMSLDLSKASGPDCIPVVVLKNCELELSYILAELFNKCLKCLVFQIVGRFLQWSLYLRILEKGLQLKTTALLVFFVWLVKSLKNL